MKLDLVSRIAGGCCAIAVLAAIAGAPAAQAAPVTSAFAGSVVTFSQFGPDNLYIGGPTEVGALVGESITMLGNSDAPGIFVDYALGDNGEWTPAGPRGAFAGLNPTRVAGQYIQFTFNNGPVGAVGGLVNYAICDGDSCAPAQDFIIEILDASNTVLETFNVTDDAPISTPGAEGEGAFRGFVRGTNDIAAIRLYNAVNVIDDLTFTRVDVEAVPAPATLALVAAGLAGLGAMRRRNAQG